MKKFLSIVLGVFFAMVLGIEAQAQDPHLTSAPSISENGDYWIVTFTVAGLGKGRFTFVADVETTQNLYCVSAGKKGQKNSAGEPCYDTTSGTTTVSNARNGSTTVTVQVNRVICPPANCPGNQKSISEYSNGAITVLLNDVPLVVK